MIRPLPAPVREVLERGALCYLAAVTRRGPHLTPVVFAAHACRLWVTTSRSSVKARTWKRDPRVGGLVRWGPLALSFTGRVRAYDLLDPSTWRESARSSPTLTLAAARFTLRNARFFAGYALDARRVPLAWTPPGRVFAGLELERAALIDAQAGRVVEAWDMDYAPVLGSRRSFRETTSRWDPLEAVPADVAGRTGRAGEAVLAVGGTGGPVVLPVRWASHRGSINASLPRELLALAGWPGSAVRLALTVDRASAWRAGAMAGVLVQGRGTAYELSSLGSGRRSAVLAVIGTGSQPEGATLVRVRPDRAVWWRGWSSGTVTPP